MTINLPTANSQTRQLIDVASVAEILSPDNRAKLPTLRQSLTSASEYFATEPAANEIYVICQKFSGAIVLERIGCRGGHNTVWTFVQP